MNIETLLENYLEGPQLLREAVAGLSDVQLDAHPIPETWSVREVVCHIADFEPVFSDRMKRVLTEDNPLLPSGDQDAYAAVLAYAHRDIETELQIIELTRRQLATVLRHSDPEDFQRTGVHAEDGPTTLESLLERITRHIPHHLPFIRQKREALGVS